MKRKSRIEKQKTINRHDIENLNGLLCVNTPSRMWLFISKGSIWGPKKLLNNRSGCLWFETSWYSCDVIVLIRSVSFFLTEPAHCNDVIRNTMTSQITSLPIVYSSVYSGADQRKQHSCASLAFVRGNSPVTGAFPSQRASNAENVSIWWRHHVLMLLRFIAAVII